MRIETNIFFRTLSCCENVSWKWLRAQFIIWCWDERSTSRKSPSLLVVEMGIFFPLPHQFVSSFCCVSSRHTKTEFSKSSLRSLGVFFFFPQQLAPIPPFPLMNWHAGRNICYYSHFLTACAAWIGSCSGRKQLSGKRGEIKKREKPLWIVKEVKHKSILEGELRQ